MKTIKNKERIKEILHQIVFETITRLPEDIKENLTISFYFEMDAVKLLKNNWCFATYQQGFDGGGEIVFYIDLISRTGTTIQGLRNLLYHELAHAVGMNEKEATKLTKNLNKII